MSGQFHIMIGHDVRASLANTSSLLLHLKSKVPDVYGKIIGRWRTDTLAKRPVTFERDNVFHKRYTCTVQLKDKRTSHKRLRMFQQYLRLCVCLCYSLPYTVLLLFVALCTKGKELYLSV